MQFSKLNLSTPVKNSSSLVLGILASGRPALCPRANRGVDDQLLPGSQVVRPAQIAEMGQQRVLGQVVEVVEEVVVVGAAASQQPRAVAVGVARCRPLGQAAAVVKQPSAVVTRLAVSRLSATRTAASLSPYSAEAAERGSAPRPRLG